LTETIPGTAVTPISRGKNHVICWVPAVDIRDELDRMNATVSMATNPTVPKNSQFAYKELLYELLRPGARWLDIGCGHKLLRSWTLSPGEDERELIARPQMSVGVDCDGPSLRANTTMPLLIAGNIEALPFMTGSFDVITANMVIEHVTDPVKLLTEVSRILRPGGQFAFHTPNSRYFLVRAARLVPQGLKNRIVKVIDGRDEADVFPAVYRMNTRDAIEKVASQSGMKLREVRMVQSSPQLKKFPVFNSLESAVVKAVAYDSRREESRSNIIAVLEKA
jgi:2-polyprenyl-3-methyl-5-hydroxy-6-metoxy-1,4-benzoquinol methylase